jgi:hypothetical protein
MNQRRKHTNQRTKVQGRGYLLGRVSCNKTEVERYPLPCVCYCSALNGAAPFCAPLSGTKLCRRSCCSLSGTNWRCCREGVLQLQLSVKIGRLKHSPEPVEVPVDARTRSARGTVGNGVLVLGNSLTPRFTMEVTSNKVREREKKRERKQTIEGHWKLCGIA